MPTGHYNRPKRPVITPIGPSISYVPLTQGYFAKIASDHAKSAGCYNWTAEKRRSGGWDAKSHMYLGNRKTKTFYLHQLVMGNPPAAGLSIDHIVTGDPLNCLPHNLRWATRRQQAHNVSRRCGKNLKGACFNRARKCWTAQIRVDGVLVYLGHFATELEAHERYRVASSKYFGEFANHG